MASVCVVALDVMGGDNGPKPCILAALKAVESYDDLHIILVGQQSVIESILNRHKSLYDTKLFDRLTIEHADNVISMSAQPFQTIRSGHNSSLWKAVQWVQKKS